MQPRETNPSFPLTAKVFSSAQELLASPWNDLAQNGSCTFSREFWETLEQAGLEGFSDYRYVMFLDGCGAPAALACFYSVTTDIAIFAPAGLREVLSRIRRVFPGFLKLRMLECGTPITLNSPPFVAHGSVPAREIIAALSRLLLKTARQEGQLLIVVRDFEADAEPMRKEFERFGYHWVDNLPNTYLEIQWPSADEYLASMKSYYRSKLLRHLRKNEAQHIRHELVDDFGHLAETLCSQWFAVHNQADEYQREVLNPQFYRELSSRMGASSKALLLYRKDELVGHALMLLDGDMLRWLYIGRKDAINDSLYIYIAHKVIETAINLGAKRVEMGLTTYSIKQDLGAQAAPLKFALRSTSRLINPLVGLFYPLLNHTPEIRNKHIFKRWQTS